MSTAVRKLARLAMVGVAAAVVTVSAEAMTFAPLHMELTTAGSRSRAQFQVTNTASEPLPVEITYEHLAYTEGGARRTSPSANELAIFPATALIPPGSTQTFRIQWVGAPDLDRSRSFSVTARQLPVRKKNDGRSHVQIVAAFSAIVNVAPLSGSADLRLVSSQMATTSQGRPAVAILVENPTRVHALISNATLSVGSQTVSPETLRSTVGIGVVEPGKRRRFVVPLSRPASGSARLSYRATTR